MKQLTMKGILNVLELMVECEGLMAELYRAASRTWRDEREFWLVLAGQEEKHAEYAGKMIGLISRDPGSYRPGRPFTEEAIKAFMARIREVIDKVQKGSVSRSGFITTMRDFEQKIIELNYGQIVITDNFVYKQLVKEIVSETAGHKSSIDSLK